MKKITHSNKCVHSLIKPRPELIALIQFWKIRFETIRSRINTKSNPKDKPIKKTVQKLPQAIE